MSELAPGASPNETDMAYAAYHDSLTGLLNRRAFGEHLDHAVQLEPGHFGVIFLDLDGLKAANDTSPDNHSGGDHLIQSAATVLQDQFRQENETPDRQTDMIARLGGDEFGVLVRGTSDSLVLHLIGTRVQQELQKHGVKTSVGTAVHTGNEPASEILGRADKMMYEDKLRRQMGNLTPTQLGVLTEVDALLSSHGIEPRVAQAAIEALRRQA